MGCPQRGYAFTRAVIGLPALELHLCGDPAMVPLVERIAAELGDSLTVKHYKRQGRACPFLPKCGGGVHVEDVMAILESSLSYISFKR